VLPAAAVFSCVLAGAALAESTDFEVLGNEDVGDSPSAVATADLDGDGDQDLAVASQGTTSVTILRNGGAGDFTEPASSPEAVGSVPQAVVAADLDGDADQDLAVANQGSDDVTILRNNGNGNFVQPASSPEAVGDAPSSLAATDLDGDLDQDLVVGNFGSENVTILRNRGNGNFVQPASSPEAVDYRATGVAAADLDGDGDQDLAVSTASLTEFTPGEVTILRNNGNGNFATPAWSPETAGRDPRSIAAADLDGDTDQDLAVANAGFGGPGTDDVTILRNKGNGNFTEPATSPEAVGERPRSIVAADFDGDGDRDLAVANLDSSDVTILANGPNANFTEPPTSPEAVGENGALSIAAADLDGDLDRDLAVANFLSSPARATILRNE
jgi:hypothetical protein